MYRILIVEDDFLIRWSLTQALLQEGYYVISAEDGKKALEATNTEQFDYIITDLVMPEIDGWQVLEKVRQTQPSSRVIVMSSFGNRDTGSVLKEKGAWAFVEKSYLIDNIKTLLKESDLPVNEVKDQKTSRTII